MQFLIDDDRNMRRVKTYSDKLEFLWGKYLTVLNLIMTLSGGTLLVFFNSIKLSDLKLYKSTELIIIGCIFAVIALISSIFWRLVTQHFMEIEVFGSAEDIENYYKLCKIDNVTSTYKNRRIRPFYKVIYKVLPSITITALVIAWAFILIFIVKNS